jgi:hypothetical protein
MSIWRLATVECWFRLCSSKDPLPASLLGCMEKPAYTFVEL